MMGFFFCFKTCAHIIFFQLSVFSPFSPFLTVHDYLFLVCRLNFWLLVPVFCVCESINEICKFTDWCYLVSQKHTNPNRHVLSQIQNQINFNSTYPISCHWCLSIPLENLRKPVFRRVQEVTSDIKWVIYMSTINKENSRVMIYICSKLAIIAKFEHIQPDNILLLFWSLIK